MSGPNLEIVKPTPNSDVIDWLHEALTQAQAGNITGLVFVVIHPGGSIHGSRGQVDARDLALATIDMQYRIAERGDDE